MLQSHNQSFAPLLNAVPKVLVGVCTYKRPKMLEMCLSSLLAQDISQHKYSILVVDNDKGKSAAEVYSLANKNSGKVSM